MANKPSPNYLPDLRGVPVNIQRELESLRQLHQQTSDALSVLSKKVVQPFDIKQIRDALQVSGDTPMNVTGLLGAGFGSGTGVPGPPGPPGPPGSGAIIAHILTLTTDTTIPIPSPATAGTYHNYLIFQDSVGGHKVTWNVAFDFQGIADQPRPDPNGVSSFLFFMQTTTQLRSVIIHRL